MDDYNDTLGFNGLEPFPVVADPENIELNRAQISYLVDGTGVTVGRQRINLGNQRFVGSVGWRQNEQTFDAVRGQLKAGVVSFDATYAISQRTIFGTDSPNSRFEGDFVLANAVLDLPKWTSPPSPMCSTMTPASGIFEQHLWRHRQHHAAPGRSGSA